MGTTLTGTTPQDTYDSLIKVTDNGPISGSLKVLSDGLGNDSTLSLSTTAASIAGTLAVTGDAAFDTDTLFVDVSAGNVGIGTAAPQQVLDTKNIVIGGATIAGTYRANSLLIDNNGGTSRFYSVAADTITTGLYTFFCANSDATINSEIVRIDSDGLKFNGDTAAANALDDYEEGTWTMGVTFGGAAVGVTYGATAGTYTKIGRQVTVNGYFELSSKGSSTGGAKVTGLPFTIANTDSNYAAASLWFNKVSFVGQFQGYADRGYTTIPLEEITVLGAVTSITDADFANDISIMVSLTYFV